MELPLSFSVPHSCKAIMEEGRKPTSLNWPLLPTFPLPLVQSKSDNRNRSGGGPISQPSKFPCEPSNMLQYGISSVPRKSCKLIDRDFSVNHLTEFSCTTTYILQYCCTRHSRLLGRNPPSSRPAPDVGNGFPNLHFAAIREILQSYLGRPRKISNGS